VAGDFSWVGLLTGDVERAKRFYGDLFGWSAEPGMTRGRQAYNVMRLADHGVALIYETSDWQRALGAPTNWATFVSVADVEATAVGALQLGGGVVIAPYDVEGAARIAVVMDPGGARLSLWEPLGDLAPRRDGTVGTCCWNELVTDNPDVAASFYGDLFGWELDREASGYRIISNRGVPQGGIRTLSGRERLRAYWLPYFRVDAVGETLERCAEAGGQIADPPSDGPVAVVRDPEGARFGVCARMPSASGGDAASPAAGAADASA
jgi:uncharacterized protein